MLCSRIRHAFCRRCRGAAGRAPYSTDRACRQSTLPCCNAPPCVHSTKQHYSTVHFDAPHYGSVDVCIPQITVLDCFGALHYAVQRCSAAPPPYYCTVQYSTVLHCTVDLWSAEAHCSQTQRVEEQRWPAHGITTRNLTMQNDPFCGTAGHTTTEATRNVRSTLLQCATAQHCTAQREGH